MSSEKVTPWKEAPKVLWRQAVGEGHSSPVVAAGRVFLHVKAKDKDDEEVVAFAGELPANIWMPIHVTHLLSWRGGADEAPGQMGILVDRRGGAASRG